MVILDKIVNKLQNIPNTEHLFIFLQRLAIKINPSLKFEEWDLNKKIFDTTTEIWNFNSITDYKLKIICDDMDIIDRDKMWQLDIYPSRDSVALFSSTDKSL